MQGATIDYQLAGKDNIISIHAPYAGSDKNSDEARKLANISIHAPYAGSDNGFYVGNAGLSDISIHAPYAGSDPWIIA